MSFDVDILAFFTCLGYFLKNLVIFFSNHLVTLTSSYGTVVEHVIHHPMIKGSNRAAWRKKMAKGI
jgi:hypothetical protein